MGKIIYPEKLEKGDTIATTAVSSTCNLEKIDMAINTFKELGLKVIETDNVRKSDGIVSSSGEKRAEELIELFRNTDVKYIIASRGGEFLMEMLPYIDNYRDVIQNNPKWLQGFSDPSLLNLYITTNFNIATINGENISEFAMNPRFESLQNNLDFLFSRDNTLVQHSFEKYQENEFEDGNTKGYNLTKEDIYESDSRNVKFSGRIIGGCIDTFEMITGTRMDNIANFVSQFDDDGVIWYIDNCELSSFELYRRLWHMSELGYFKNVRGFVFGRSFMENNENIYFTFKDAIKRALKKYDVPIIYKADVGHIPPQMIMINGSYGTFEFKDGKGTLVQRLI